MTRSMRNSMNKSGEINPKYMFDGSYSFFGMKKSNANNNVNNEINGNNMFPINDINKETKKENSEEPIPNIDSLTINENFNSFKIKSTF